MEINGLIWLRHIVDKLAFKHQVDTDEVEEALQNKPRFRFVGRYLAVLFVYKKTKEALVVSARGMASKERKMYGKK